MKKRNGKYNASKVEIDGITFDSKAEGEFHLWLKEIQPFFHFTCELQPEYVLLGKTVKHGRTFNPIKYKSDFLLRFPCGTTLVIDVKGMLTPEFKLKEKLFFANFDEELICVSKSNIDGGWIREPNLKHNRKIRKAIKEGDLKKVDRLGDPLPDFKTELVARFLSKSIDE
ncbi:Holliday junction resolvase [Bacillus phage Blastoid]|uniref:Holliday junction resolvase n=1 Tax=Bacillus phage Blastoid TaxID=2880540 RepID=U5PSA8_9CAUD|nr:Holliday junction resolvase [Bacillus phage Blastoid]AGY46845.1 Holliday junction resolvase [Bacillus phage Blastoid]